MTSKQNKAFIRLKTAMFLRNSQLEMFCASTISQLEQDILITKMIDEGFKMAKDDPISFGTTEQIIQYVKQNY